MTLMTTEAPSFLPQGREFTRADLEQVPNDGHRYELIDGLLIVSPAPRVRHQKAVLNLAMVLHAARPAQLDVLVAPLDVVLANDTVIQPDLVVAPSSAFTEKNLPTAPLLAIEILSPATRGADLLLKKDRLQRAGCAHYWVIDPDEPSIIAWTLTDGTYRETVRARGQEEFATELPFPVAFTPAVLLS